MKKYPNDVTGIFIVDDIEEVFTAKDCLSKFFPLPLIPAIGDIVRINADDILKVDSIIIDTVEEGKNTIIFRCKRVIPASMIDRSISRYSK